MTGIPYDWLEGLLVLLGTSVLLVAPASSWLAPTPWWLPNTRLLFT